MSCRWILVDANMVNRLLLSTHAATSNLPQDVSLRHVEFDQGKKVWRLLLESATWECPKEGEPFPEITPIWTWSHSFY